MKTKTLDDLRGDREMAKGGAAGMSWNTEATDEKTVYRTIHRSDDHNNS